MRAAILVLAAVVVVLAVSIVREVERRPDELRETGPRFDIVRLLPDAVKGEWAQYREEGSNRRLQWIVVDRPPPQREEAPHLVIRRDVIGVDGELDPSQGGPVAYPHQLVHHGWFPFLTPEKPGELDRVWIVRGIRRDRLKRGGVEQEAWRVEFLDPALPEEFEAVVAWFDERLPVFGLIQWTRYGETWVFERGGGPGA